MQPIFNIFNHNKLCEEEKRVDEKESEEKLQRTWTPELINSSVIFWLLFSKIMYDLRNIFQINYNSN